MDRLEAAYFDIPIITRTWATLILIVSLLCHFNVISPFHLVFGTHFILKRKEYWRLFSSFFYFGNFGIDFLFHVFFLTRYCRLLEQGSFRNRPADFLWMLLYSAVSILVLAWFFLPNKLELLSSPMTFVIVYIWSRRNPFIRMNFLGVLNFQAPYLPWVLLGFGTLLNGIPWNDLMGALVGHLYWYFEDIYPRLQVHTNATTPQPRSLATTRRRIFQAPRFLMDLMGQVPPSNESGLELPPEPEVVEPRLEDQEEEVVPLQEQEPVTHATTSSSSSSPPRSGPSETGVTTSSLPNSIKTIDTSSTPSTSVSYGVTSESTVQRTSSSSSNPTSPSSS